MRYTRFEPTSRLAPYVESIWVQEERTDASCHPFPATRVLPTGTPDIAFYWYEPFTWLGPGGRASLPEAVVTGPQTSYREYAATGRTGIVLVRFRPGAATAILRIPQCEIRDRNVDLGDIVGRAALRRLMAGLRGARGHAARAGLVQAYVESLIGAPAPAEVRAAVTRIRATWGRDPVPALARAAGLSSRQLQRRFAEHVGVSPKTLERLVRFQNALHVHAAGATWSMTALEAGYQDQSHLTNECRALTGLSPGRVFRRRRATPLAEFFNGAGAAGSAFRTVYL